MPQSPTPEQRLGRLRVLLALVEGLAALCVRLAGLAAAGPGAHVLLDFLGLLGRGLLLAEPWGRRGVHGW